MILTMSFHLIQWGGHPKLFEGVGPSILLGTLLGAILCYDRRYRVCAAVGVSDRLSRKGSFGNQVLII